MFLATSLGAVISGRYFRNPVALAKLILKDTLHCTPRGQGALRFAMEKDSLFVT